MADTIVSHQIHDDVLQILQPVHLSLLLIESLCQCIGIAHHVVRVIHMQLKRRSSKVFQIRTVVNAVLGESIWNLSLAALSEQSAISKQLVGIDVR